MRVRLTPSAERDLEDIEIFISADNPGAAIETVLGIIDSIQILADHPEVGRSGRIEGTREYVVPGTSFIAAYRITSDQIEVLRVLHGAREWPSRV